MLPQSVKALGHVRRKAVFDVEGLLAIQLDRIVSTWNGIALAEKFLAASRAVSDIAPLRSRSIFSASVVRTATSAVCDTWNLAPGHDSFESSIHGWSGLTLSGGPGVADEMYDRGATNRDVEILRSHGCSDAIRSERDRARTVGSGGTSQS